MKKIIAEFIGTLWLVLGGCGSVVLAAAYPELGIGFVGVSIAFGLTVLTMAYAIGHISGCHLNPAVSIGLWVGGRFDKKELLPYIIAQVLGAIVGAGILYSIANGKAGFEIGTFAANGYGEHSPGGYSLVAALVTEIVMTFMFLFIILGATQSKAPKGFAGITIGLGLTLIHLISIPVTNTSVNPARSTSQALFVGDWAIGQLWLFWLAPIIGAVLAGLIFNLKFMKMKHLKKVAVLALLLITGFSNVNAQDKNNPWQLGIGVNVVDIRTPDDFSGALKDYVNGSIEDLNMLPAISRITVGRYLTKGFSLQLAGSLNEIKKGFGYSKGDPETNDMFLAIDAKVKYDLNNLFGQTGWFDPFILLGGGYTKIGDEGASRLGAGWGFNTWFNNNVGLSFQSDYNHRFKSTGTDYFQHSLGLVFKFGGDDTDGDGINDKDDACPNVFGMAEYKGCPDSDNDGIIDSEDACPNMVGLAVLNGCPDADEDGIADKDDACPNVKGTKANRGCPDTDGDGVLDNNDGCPKVAGPSANKGCPWPDTDGDGVLDKDDDCVNEAGLASNKGCPQITTKELVQIQELFKTVYFDTGKNSFKSETYSKLDAAAKIMKKYKKDTYIISGHTDNTGNSERNQELSVSRANAVKSYLISKGVSSSKLSTKGYGKDMPIASNDTREGRAQNRRVEIRLTN